MLIRAVSKVTGVCVCVPTFFPLYYILARRESVNKYSTLHAVTM